MTPWSGRWKAVYETPRQLGTPPHECGGPRSLVHSNGGAWGGAKWNIKWRRGHVERRHPNHEDWTPADWVNVIADTLAGQGWSTESALRHNEPGAPKGVTPGGIWHCRLTKSCTFHPDSKGSKSGHFSSSGPEPWQPLHGPLKDVVSLPFCQFEAGWPLATFDQSRPKQNKGVSRMASPDKENRDDSTVIFKVINWHSFL